MTKKKRRPVLHVELGSTSYEIPADIVQEVAESPALTALPGVHPAVAGLANVRGMLMTAVDLGLLLTGAPAAAPTGRVLVIVEVGGRRVALVVDSATALAEGSGQKPLDVPVLVAPVFGT